MDNKQNIKTGILTFHRAKNYGAVLQTFALQHVLKSMEVDVYILNRYEGHKSLIHKIYYIFHPRLFIQRLSWILFNKFPRKYLRPKTKKYKTRNSLANFKKKENFDAVVVGSDQIWRMEFSQIGYNYFLDFIDSKETRKISYAASFGKDKWSENKEVTAQVKKLINDFQSVSVRETSGVSICSEVFNVEATQVLDPSLLLTKEDYESILLKNLLVSNNNSLISYILGDKKDSLKYCNCFAKSNGLNFFDLYHIYKIKSILSPPDCGKKRYLHVSVPEWLNQIRNAKYVVTNSFHATIFSILFQKQFIVVDHQGGGTTRINSLLNLLDLKDRFVTDISEISIELFEKSVDWNSVNKILAKEKNDSILFLQNSLINEL